MDIFNPKLYDVRTVSLKECKDSTGHDIGVQLFLPEVNPAIGHDSRYMKTIRSYRIEADRYQILKITNKLSDNLYVGRLEFFDNVDWENKNVAIVGSYEDLTNLVTSIEEWFADYERRTFIL